MIYFHVVFNFPQETSFSEPEESPPVAGAGSTRVLRRGIGFEILCVQLGTVELLVLLLETIEKNASNGHFRRFSSDLSVLYHKLHVICDTKPSGLLLAYKTTCKFFWRQHCNKTTCVLKRRVTASRRFKNYPKRLITFGFTARNVK